VKNLLGPVTSKSFVNPLVCARFFSKDELARAFVRTDLIDPHEASKTTIYTVGLEELGDEGLDLGDRERRVLPDYILRQKLLDQMVISVPPDARLCSFSTVRDDILFEIDIHHANVKPSPTSREEPRHAGARVTFRFAHQAMTRAAPGASLMRPDFPSLVLSTLA
jgi:hypothetical protein